MFLRSQKFKNWKKMEVILNQTKYSGYVPITFRNSELKKVELKLLLEKSPSCSQSIKFDCQAAQIMVSYFIFLGNI